MYLFYFLILLLILVFIGAYWGTPWIPTSKGDFDRIAKLARLQPKILFYDLGSGTAEMLFYLSKKYNINCVGIEISPLLFLYSKIKSLFFPKVKIKYGDFYRYDLSSADVIYVFLHPKIYGKLKDKIDKNTKKGTKIILSCWPFQDWEPVKISKKNNGITYYLYIKKEGHFTKEMASK